MRCSRLGLILLALALLAGCGSSSTSARIRDATVVLDFTPNPVHTGFYAAIAHHFDRANGLHLHVQVPSSTTDSVKLLQSGRVNFAVLDIHDLAIARARGADIVGIMALVQRPLAAVIAGPGIPAPRRLEGRTVGITGVPSDMAVLRSIVAGAGGDPARVKTVTIGFNAVADLLAGRVAAATGFWNDEGVTVAARRRGFHSLRVDQYGAPSYPELVVCATGRRLSRDRGLARAIVRTLAYGYAFTLANPQRGAADLESFAPGLDPKLVAAELELLLPAFKAPDGAIGELNGTRLRSWAAWEKRFGIVSRTPDVAASFDPSLADAARSIGTGTRSIGTGTRSIGTGTGTY